MAQAYNPNYSADSWFEASWGKQFMRPYLENTHHKKGW
jgi:hypothetical protein